MSHMILTKDTVSLFIHRLNKMLQKHGKVKLNHTYSGAQAIKGYILQQIPDADYPLCPFVRTSESIIRRNDVAIEADNEPNMQLVRVNWNKNRYTGYEYGSGMYIRYGTKITIHSNKIEWKDKHVVSNTGMISTITI